jgi:hypothetical protein
LKKNNSNQEISNLKKKSKNDWIVFENLNMPYKNKKNGEKGSVPDNGNGNEQLNQMMAPFLFGSQNYNLFTKSHLSFEFLKGKNIYSENSATIEDIIVNQEMLQQLLEEHYSNSDEKNSFHKDSLTHFSEILKIFDEMLPSKDKIKFETIQDIFPKHDPSDLGQHSTKLEYLQTHLSILKKRRIIFFSKKEIQTIIFSKSNSFLKYLSEIFPSEYSINSIFNLSDKISLLNELKSSTQEYLPYISNASISNFTSKTRNSSASKNSIIGDSTSKTLRSMEKSPYSLKSKVSAPNSPHSKATKPNPLTIGMPKIDYSPKDLSKLQDSILMLDSNIKVDKDQIKVENLQQVINSKVSEIQHESLECLTSLFNK